MDENTKKIAVRIGITVAVVAVLSLTWYLGKNSGLNSNNGGQTSQSFGNQPPPSTTRQPAPVNIEVPEPTSTASVNVAKPQIVAPAAPGSSSSFRSFSIKVSGNKFTPDTIIVNAGDQLRLNITATDKDYDFFQPDYGLSMPLPKGQTKVIPFQATAADKYTFYCKSCGGPANGPVGYIVVAAK